MLAASTQRVRRHELHSPASSPRSSPDRDLQELLRSRFANHFTYTTADTAIPDADHAAVSDQDETELRLFAAPANHAPQTHKIRLSSPGAGDAEPGFLRKKPRSYYFAEDPTSDEESALHAAALDGNTILELSKDPWPGCALPWKVRTLPTAGTRREILAAHSWTFPPAEEKAHKRTRKGKKTRIALRKKVQATKERQDTEAKLAKEREEADREKRTRRNREKKLKKKAKSQAQKASGEADDGVAGHVHVGQDSGAED